MRWLQWSTSDLKHGLGGVEVHARSLARELQTLGIDAELSSDVQDLKRVNWDVIHSHGSTPLPRNSITFDQRSKPILVHTLHGTTLGRMAGCGEWAWIGGYRAAARETQGALRSDVVLSIHPDLHLYRLAGKLGKSRGVCGNGWDAGTEDAPLPNSASHVLQSDTSAGGGGEKPCWLFLGRGHDPVKGADRLKKLLSHVPDLRFAAAPGDGFEDCPQILKTGLLTSSQVRTLLKSSAGLLLPSRYEGLPLVVLEALALGLPVVSTQVGGLIQLARTSGTKLQGWVQARSGDPRALADAIRGASTLQLDPSSRATRAAANQRIIPTWKAVAESSLAAVSKHLAPTLKT